MRPTRTRDWTLPPNFAAAIDDPAPSASAYPSPDTSRPRSLFPWALLGGIVLVTVWISPASCMGTFSDAPLHHPGSELIQKGKPRVARERCEEPAH